MTTVEVAIQGNVNDCEVCVGAYVQRVPYAKLFGTEVNFATAMTDVNPASIPDIRAHLSEKIKYNLHQSIIKSNAPLTRRTPLLRCNVD